MTVLAVMRYEINRFLKQGRVFTIFFLAVIIYGVYYPQPYMSEVLRDVPIAIVDQDQTILSRQLGRDIDASTFAAVVERLPDVEAARRAVFTRKLHGFVLIPEHFERDVLHQRRSPVAFYGDASYFLIFSKSKSAVSSAVSNLGANVVTSRLIAGGMTPEQAATAASPISINLIPLYNPEGGYASYVVPAVFLLIFQQLLLIGIGLLNTLPNESGPPPAAGALTTTAGKLAAYMIPAAFVFIAATVFVPYFYHIPRIGTVLPNLAVGIPFALAAASLGLVIATVFRNPLIVQLVGNTIGMPLFFMAGITWPREDMPELLQSVSYLIPSTSGISATVRVNQMAATAADVAAQIWVLVALAIFYTALATLAEKWRSRKAVQADADGIIDQPAQA